MTLPARLSSLPALFCRVPCLSRDVAQCVDGSTAPRAVIGQAEGVGRCAQSLLSRFAGSSGRAYFGGSARSGSAYSAGSARSGRAYSGGSSGSASSAGRLVRGVGIGLTGVMFALSSHAETLTLKLLLETVYTTSPSLFAARSAQTIADEDRATQRARGLPNLAVSLSATQSSTNVTSPPDEFPNQETGTTSTTPIALSFSLSQSLYSGGINRELVKRADFGIEAGRYQLTAMESGTLYQAIVAWYNWKQAIDAIDVAEKNVARFQKHLERASELLEFNRATQSELLAAESSLRSAEASLVQRQNAVRSAEVTIVELFGEAPNPDQPDALDFTQDGEVLQNLLAQYPQTIEQAVEPVDAHPNVLAAKKIHLQATTSYAIARGALRPQVSLTASSAYQLNSQGAGHAAINTQVGVNFGYNFFRGGEVWSGYRQGLQAIKNAEYQVEVQQRSVTSSIETAWYLVANGQATLASLKSALDAAAAAREAVQEEYDLARRTVFDLVDADQAVFDVEQGIVDFETSTVLARFQVLYAMGLITPENLQLGVPTYNPATYTDNMTILGLRASEEFQP
ncbi:MAG: TolC family protein [Alphaproteobacteria bacterium]|nr:TolC family protein [Alphaproteobacteria bacterium]